MSAAEDGLWAAYGMAEWLKKDTALADCDLHRIVVEYATLDHGVGWRVTHQRREVRGGVLYITASGQPLWPQTRLASAHPAQPLEAKPVVDPYLSEWETAQRAEVDSAWTGLVYVPQVETGTATSLAKAVQAAAEVAARWELAYTPVAWEEES